MTQDRSLTSAQKDLKKGDKTRMRCASVTIHGVGPSSYSPLLLPLTLALRNGDAPSYLFAYWSLLRIGQGGKERKSLFKF